jgi:hypothetical protein
MTRLADSDPAEWRPLQARPATAAAAAAAASPNCNASAAATTAAAAGAYCTPSAASATSAASCGATSAASCGATSAAAGGNFFDELGCVGVFPVEDVKRRQVDVKNFLFVECNWKWCAILRRYVCYRHGCGCAARHGQRSPGGSQYRQGYPPALSFRSSLRVRHDSLLHITCGAKCQVRHQ